MSIGTRRLRLTLLHTKGERSGLGVSVANPYGTTALCPIRALRAWQDAARVRAFGERIRAAHPTRPAISTVAECVAVTVQRRSAAQMSVKQLGSLGEKAFLHQVDHSLHGLPLIHRVGDHAFQPCG
jgi:hypothetical protein